MDLIPNWVIEGATPITIVTVIVWMILTGRLTPRSVVQLYKDNATKWEAAYYKQAEISETLMSAVGENTKTGAVVVKTMDTLQAAADTTTEGPTP